MRVVLDTNVIISGLNFRDIEYMAVGLACIQQHPEDIADDH